MKKLYLTSVALVEDAQRLADEIAKYNPGISSNSKKTIHTLAADAGTLAYEFAKLRTEINQKEKTWS